MRYPVKVGMIRSLVPRNPEGIRRNYVDRYDWKSRNCNERNWKSYRNHQWRVEKIGQYFEVPVASIRGTEYQEFVDRVFGFRPDWEEWLQDYLDSLPENLYEDVWDVQAEEDGLYDFDELVCKHEEE